MLAFLLNTFPLLLQDDCHISWDSYFFNYHLFTTSSQSIGFHQVISQMNVFLLFLALHLLLFLLFFHLLPCLWHVYRMEFYPAVKKSTFSNQHSIFIQFYVHTHIHLKWKQLLNILSTKEKDYSFSEYSVSLLLIPDFPLFGKIAGPHTMF